ncbi:MAG TPA: hypothetical protein VMV94_12115 [Phycisphaerae bacterium]|nr:hypothetical protein [Phycisphaerae bacterium]
MVLRQKVILISAVVINLVAWSIPDNVVALVAKDQQTLLGRYSRGHFAVNISILVLTAAMLYIDQARSRQTMRRRQFQILAVLLVGTPLLVVVDVVLRLTRASDYVFDGTAYRRPPNACWSGVVRDQPQAHLSYPNLAPGFPSFPYTLRSDARGFRNATASDRTDVVAVGDSFVEGSHVSDEHLWPVRFAALSDLAVYSLGMSGYSPIRNLEAIRRYGLALHPRHVICMLNEGNDFRLSKSDQEEPDHGPGKFFQVCFKDSPLVKALDQALIRAFGGVGRGKSNRKLDILSWLPLRVPDGPDGKYYAFAPKQITQAYLDETSFEKSPEWDAVRSTLAEMRDACAQSGCRFVIAYAPTKAHVLMPLVVDRLPAEKVRAFCCLGSKKVPEAGTLMANLVPYLDSRAAIVRRWCAAQSIPFVDLTEALREALSRGQQVYFTYDQHWTPLGHEVVARTMANFWTNSGLASSSPTTPAIPTSTSSPAP